MGGINVAEAENEKTSNFSPNAPDVRLASMLGRPLVGRMCNSHVLLEFLLYFTSIVYALVVASADSGVPGSGSGIFFFFHLPIYICYFRNPAFCWPTITSTAGMKPIKWSFLLAKSVFKLKPMRFLCRSDGDGTAAGNTESHFLLHVHLLFRAMRYVRPRDKKSSAHTNHTFEPLSTTIMFWQKTPQCISFCLVSKKFPL